MKAVVITNKGLEIYSSKEIKKILNCETEIKENLVFFEAEKKEIINLAYQGRTFQRVVIILHKGIFEKNPLDNLKEIKAKIQESFSVDGERYGNHEFTSFELKNKLGKLISKITGKKFDIKKGLTKFYFYIKNKEFILGIDVAGFDLSKRDYRIFLSPENIKPTIAVSMLLEANYSSEKVLLDPFSRSGIIAIEAALMAINKSVHYHEKNKFSEKTIFKDEIKKIKPKIYCYDKKFQHLNAAKKNAKIAEVNKLINFSRQEIKNLDLKFKKKIIDCIITQTPKFSSKKNIHDLLEIYKEFFEQAKKILKKKGKIVMLVNDLKIKKLTKFKLIKEVEIVLGDHKFWILNYQNSQ